MLSITGFQKYESYKDSDVEKIGSIPCAWEVQKLKFLTSINSESLPDNTPSKYSLEYVDIGSVSFENGIERTETFAFKDAPSRARRRARSGDVVVSTVRTYLKAIAYVDDEAAKYTYSTGFAVVSPVEQLISDYLSYFVKSNAFTEQVDLIAKGMSYPAINSTELSNLYLTCAPADEQKLIAKFLDKKTTQIDEAIAIKEQQIALLKERKQIIIQKAVTQGLDPTVSMKDSGVDWIGEIPAHWEVKKLKYLGDAIIGLTYSPADLCGEGEGVLVARSSNLFDGRFRYGDKENVYVKTKVPSKLLLREGDILICSRNGSRDLIGKCAYASESDAGASFGAFTTVFRSVLNGYLFHILNSDIFKMLSGTFLTSTINQLTVGNLNSIEVPIPGLDEQKKIANYIIDVSSKIDSAVEIQVLQIARLKEYKTTLINSAVTGKIRITPDMVEA